LARISADFSGVSYSWSDRIIRGLTTALGIAGAFVATYLGQALGWYQAGQGAGFITSIVGAALILLVWGFIARRTQ